MKKLLYYVHMWRGYMRLGVLTLVQYPADTCILVISMLLREAAGFVGVITIANVRGSIGNWSVYDICLLFSMCAIIESIGQLFFDNVWWIDQTVRRGRMDIFLVRPLSPFFQLLGDYFHFSALISMAVYIVLFVWALLKTEIVVTAGTVLFILEFLVCATVINSGIYAIFNTLNFWLVRGEDIAVLVQTCREFAKYPLKIFPILIQGFFTYLIPFGFVGYYPAEYLTGNANAGVIAGLPLCAAVVAGCAAVFWRAGVRGYNSTGT